MRHHLSGHDAPSKRSADAAKPERPTRSGLDLPALQRLAGNAAVVQFLKNRDAGPQDSSAESPATVQRSLAHEVLSGTGRPLPEPTRREMEVRLGADFSSVRVHDDAKARRSAAELGARAYTSGEHVVIGDGGGDRHTLAHELTHVIQQRQGPVAGADNGGGLRVSDPGDRFERDAEENARRSLAAPLPAASTAVQPAAARATDVPAHAHTAACGHTAQQPEVQRALQVGRIDFTKEYKQRTSALPPREQELVLDTMVKEVTKGFLGEAAPNFSRDERTAFVNEQNRIDWQLRKAIVAPVGYKGYHPVLKGQVGRHPDFGAKNHDIRVNNYTELARNLMGWVYAKDNRHREKEAALDVQNGGQVELFLNVVLRRVARFAQEVQRARGMSPRQIAVMHEELRTGLSHIESQPLIQGRHGPIHDRKKADQPVGAYLAYFDGTFNPKFANSRLATRMIDKGGLLALLETPEKFSFRDKMIALHDLSEYFGHSRHTPPTMGKEAVAEIDDEDTWSTAGWDGQGRRLQVHDRGQNPVVKADGTVKEHPSTRNENSLTTRLARSRNVPVWAGQSYTAARMFKLAQASGASREEIAAVGWGIFSFWRLDFDHTTEFAYHTLHEVMDIAQNYDVPYDIDDRYASLPLANAQRIADRLTQLHASTDAVYQDAKKQVRAMRELVARQHDRMVTDQEERFLQVAESVAQELRDLRGDLAERIDRFRRWQDLSGRDRTRLLTWCLNNPRPLRERMKRLSQQLDAVRP
ncbi:eCIS core domain-containing protein [Streptacidiphilus neutrinimicus]|uniref:eCIS core domain-containing protein n=1 Tax=Streptacidiphilus neutrinimicus TaxID=105420 RepID=UPI0006948923|nr:DUF4157 domain-containing protein [Streptacidiphilus neutrinimicus]